jgi:hypothetical protein
MKHDHSLDHMKLDQIRDNILSQFRAKSTLDNKTPAATVLKKTSTFFSSENPRHTLSVFNRKSVNAIRPVMDWSYLPNKITEESVRDQKTNYKS